MSNQNNIKEVMKNHQLVPVITFQEGGQPEQMMDFLINQGIKCIEITLRTPSGINAIARLKEQYNISDILIGAGTVTNKNQIQELKQIGADFMVSPGLTQQLKNDMEESGIPYLPGVATPSEIMKAKEMGLKTLKFFPANLFGGLSALKTFGNLFPDISFCPTGGIKKDTSKEYLALDNVFAVGGSWFQADFDLVK